jgi:SAM-dependent methyltransferase
MSKAAARAAYDPFAWFYNEYWSRTIPRQLMTALERFFIPLLPARSRILDVCCGTGQIAAELTARGFQVTGLDASREMLRYARRNAPLAKFTAADARSFNFAPAYEAAISTFDSLNHFLSMKELAAVFHNVRRALVKPGLFFFDVNLEKGFLRNWQEMFSVVEADKVCVIHGKYDRATRIGWYEFTLFRPARHCWQRSGFIIQERCFSQAEIKRALKAAGFRHAVTYDAEKDAGLVDHAGRVFFLAR